MGPTQSPIQWVRGALPQGVKWPRREADHSHASSAEIENAWNYTSTPSTPSWRGAYLKHRYKFTFTCTWRKWLVVRMMLSTAALDEERTIR